MKKLFLSVIAAIAGLSAYAAEPVLQFVDAEGNVISGTTVTAVAEYDEEGEFYMAESLAAVKNVSDNNYYCVLSYYGEEVPTNASLQVCATGSCFDYPEGEEIDVTSNKMGIKAGAKLKLQDECFFGGDGEYTLTFDLVAYTGEKIDGKMEYTEVEGSDQTVTIHYVSGKAGINNLGNDNVEVAKTYFDLSGREITAPANGLYIVRTTYANGSAKVEKQYIK